MTLPLFLLVTSIFGCKQGPCDAATNPDCVYRFAMVKDITPADRLKGTGTDGADIHGISLTLKTGSDPIWASQVHACVPGVGDNSAASDCTYVMGDGTAGCAADPVDYTALGGEGGYVIVSFNGRVMATDDVMRAFECRAGDNRDDYDETYEIWVGINSDPEDPSWLLCGGDLTAEESCTIDLEPED